MLQPRMLALLIMASAAPAQDPISGLPNLVPNGGFDERTTGWRVTMGPYGQGQDRWEAAAGSAEVVQTGADEGAGCLRLNATEQDGEVDVSTGHLPVEAGRPYLLTARVRQLAGDGRYKVVIDWMDEGGEHISYDNDWRGHDRPAAYVTHGGVFVAPDGAAQAVVLVGVAKGVECLFDAVRLCPLPEDALGSAPDGQGEVEAALAQSVEAGGYGTFRLTYRAGAGGLPAGAAVEFRRSNVDPRWSPVQTSDSGGAGYTSVQASNGALFLVQPGNPEQVPSVTRVVLLYPGLEAGDTLEIVYGDIAAGGPGAEVQPKAEGDIRFVLATDGDRDGRALDLPDTAPFAVVPGPFAQLGLVTPVVAESGRPFLVTLEARDRFGNVVPSYDGEVTISTVDEDPPFEGRVRFTRRDGGRHPVRLTLKRRGPRTVRAESGGAQAEQALVVTDPPARPETPPRAKARAYRAETTFILENEHVRLLLPETALGYGVGFLEALDGDTWRPVGVFRSMGEIWTGEEGSEPAGTPIWLPEAEPQSGDGAARLTLTGDVETGGASWEARVDCRLSNEARHVDFRCRISAQEGAALRAFYGPSLHVGDGSFGTEKTTALFPGLEYLVGEEVSSGDYGVVPPHSERSVPHPYKVTMPCMAVATPRVCAAVFWDPNQVYDGGHRYPSACFASPERRGDRANHFLGLFAPSVMDGVPENARALPQPRTLEAGQALTLELSVAALAPASDVTDAVRYWFEIHGVPDAPPLPRPFPEAEKLVVRGLTETAWDAEERGWHNALSDPWGARYDPGIALLLTHYAQLHPQAPEAAGIAEELDGAGRRTDLNLAFYDGNAASALANEASAGLQSALAMASDGSYGFHPHTGNKMISQAQSKSMGRDGEVVVGTCVMALEPLLRGAWLTGDPTLVEYGEKGLACLAQFSRPQGAENWEVPLACPNLRAAGLAARCYLYGYLLTGEQQYLERAKHWATTGLPFIYLWSADDRPIMRYASISVMGTTLHTGTWFGRPVQWVGLEYADTLHALAAHDDSFPWDKIADGILTCAMQLQKTAASPCGHVGFYPDAYDTVTGDEAYHWCLAPTRVGDLLNALHDTDPRISATVVRTPAGNIHIVAPGRVSEAALEGSTLRFTSDFPAGLTHEIVLARVADASEVRIDGGPLARSELMGPQDVGWKVEPGGMVRVRVARAGESIRVEVGGCTPVGQEAALDLGAVANGGFEEGLFHWMPGPPAGVRVTDDAHSGAQAIELDATGQSDEVQCTGRPVSVTGGRAYQLSAWVKQTAGEGLYKVTINWIGPGGHLTYDNDWQGENRPTEYTEHGGRFVAPEDATSAVIILGVRAGSACRFDDVELRREK